jgi:GNAT superfamily N-acetyltransferase
VARAASARYDGTVSDLELVHVTDQTELQRWWQIDDATMSADHVALPADPIEELVPALSGPIAGYGIELWLAMSGGRDIGCAKLTMPLHDNLDNADIDIAIHPEHRSQGLGRRLAEAMLARVRALGRVTVTAEVSSPLGEDCLRSHGARLAQRFGAAPALTEKRRLLDLTGVDTGALEALQADAASHASGYVLMQWVDRVPDSDVDDFAALMVAMSTDAPTGELVSEPEVWDAVRYRAKEDSAVARARKRIGTAARDTATGRLVGFTDLGVSVVRPEVGYQWDTIVRSDHRGHRLGLLLKLTNLRQLREVMPATRYVNTWNADTNAPMVAVNDALGFRAVETMQEWQLHL